MESMGLAAPRRKTKYDIDPRNNAWANDENKFGQKLMEKFGWEKGKGLGANEDGETQNIKVIVKNDKHGIGANNDYSDTWLDHQDDFNSVLASLNTCHSAPGSGTATPTNEESTDRVAGSMEERSKTSKSRVHYKKFTQGKDLTRANASDLDALFGRRKNFEKRSKKGKKAAASEPATPFAGMTPLGTTPVGGKSPKPADEALTSHPLEADSSQDKEYDADGNLKTVTSSLSVSDYFAKKMAEIKAKRNGVSTAVDQFCENSCKQSQKNQEEGVESEERGKEDVEISLNDKAGDLPEVYAQEKFQKASLTVQQYFELKMKEKKANHASQLDALVGDVPYDGSPAEGIDGEKKKKRKKKKMTEHVSIDAPCGLNSSEIKKKTINEGVPAAVSEITRIVSCDASTEDCKRNKKKKRKREEENGTNLKKGDGDVPVILLPKKKKKKTETAESTSNEISPSAGSGLDAKKTTSVKIRKEKKKIKKLVSSAEGRPINKTAEFDRDGTETHAIPKKKKKTKKVVS